MEVKLVEDKECTLHVEILYPEMNSGILRLAEKIKGLDAKIIGEKEGSQLYLSVQDIYYIESIERKTFIYTKNNVYRTNKKLYQLTEELRVFNFFQINKQCLLNINVLAHVKTLFNSRLEATLDNGEKVIITRTYIPEVKQWLMGEGR